jgi:hypothetical protein
MQKMGKSYRLPYNPTNVQTKQKSSASFYFLVHHRFLENLKLVDYFGKT